MRARKAWYDIALLVVLYLFSSTNFYFNYIETLWLNYVISITLRIVFLIFAYIFIKKNAIVRFERQRFKKDDLLLLPLLLITFSNVIVGFILGISPNLISNWVTFSLGAFIDALTALAEELIFRVVIISHLMTYSSRTRTLLYSSLIFALIHLVNISSISMIVFSLVQIAYTLILGLILGGVYMMKKNYVYIVCLHFLFNFINGTLTQHMYHFPNDLTFILVNVIIGGLVLVYGYLLYQQFLRKEDNTYVT